MKKATTILCCIVIILLCTSAYGADSVYGRIGIGLSMPGNSDILDYTIPGARVTSEFKKSMLGSIAVGQEYKNFRFEEELSYQSNEYHGADIAGVNTPIKGELSALTFMVNGYFDFKNYTDYTPYLTAGLGASQMYISDLYVPAMGFGPTSDDDYVMAYQLGFGLLYKMDSKISIDLNYRYFVPSDPDFNTVQTELASHNISIGLKFTF